LFIFVSVLIIIIAFYLCFFLDFSLAFGSFSLYVATFWEDEKGREKAIGA